MMLRPLALVLLASMGLGTSWALAQGATQDPLLRWRARVEQSKLAALPPPQDGAQDISWQRLLAPDLPGAAEAMASSPSAVASGTDDGQHDHARDHPPAGSGVATGPAVLEMAAVRLTGFALPLDARAGSARTVLLTPYRLLASGRPAPAGNQMVVASLRYAFPDNMRAQPIWITGTIQTQSTPTPYGTADYMIVQGRWQPYPHQKFRLPPYHAPHP